MEHRYFPFFIDITGKKVLVAGAGSIALRRVSALLRFGAVITVVAPEMRDEFQILQQQYGTEYLHLEQKTCDPELVTGYDLVLTATDSPRIDRMIWESCKRHHVWINVASDQSLCDFRFPALAETEELVVGITSNSGDHKKVRSVSAQIREVLETENFNLE